MIALMTMSIVLAWTLCVLAYRLAVYAFPVIFGFEIARVAHQTAAGIIGASAVGFIAGAVAYGALSMVFVSLRSPAARIIIGLIFALPAAGAGSALILGISATAIPSDLWRQMFSVIAGLLVGAMAFVRLSGPASAHLA